MVFLIVVTLLSSVQAIGHAPINHLNKQKENLLKISFSYLIYLVFAFIFLPL
ncbi:hypothetical protein FORMB_08380 [Formosa sp. Hel1_33_131]|nr:hypothetical protein FORMB_08380 [Formosa sp. Hel1_33_131]